MDSACGGVEEVTAARSQYLRMVILEDSVLILIKVRSLDLPGGSEENYEEPQSG
jgi:hypothetical protein